jgi:hypothetical protein
VAEQGAGTGFVVTVDEVIAVNDHVVAGAQTIAVPLAGGRRLPACVRGQDPRRSLRRTQPLQAAGIPAVGWLPSRMAAGADDRHHVCVHPGAASKGGGGRVRLVRTAEGSRDLQGRCRTFHDDRESAFGLRGQLRIIAMAAGTRLDRTTLAMTGPVEIAGAEDLTRFELTASVAVQAAAVFDDLPAPDALPPAPAVTRATVS